MFSWVLNIKNKIVKIKIVIGSIIHRMKIAETSVTILIRGQASITE